MIRFVLTAVLWSLAATMGAEAAEKAKIFTFSVIERDYDRYRRFMAERDPMEIKDLKSDLMNRHLMEMMVFQIAPTLGGCDCKVVYEGSPDLPTETRAMALVARGAYLAYPAATWSNDPNLTQSILLSDPLLEAEKMFVGLYTHEGRKDVLGITNLEALRKLRFVVGERWETDKAVLEKLKLQYTTADHWEAALTMLKVGRVDAFMQPFTPREDFSFKDEALGETYKPVPGVKMRFSFSRNYYVSGVHPEGRAFLEALNRGISKLRRAGFIDQGLVAAGVIDPRVADWRILE